jgi:hypothetical protein
MSDIEADISLLISKRSAITGGLAVECKIKLGFCNDGFCFSNVCIGLNGFFVVDGLSVVVCIWIVVGVVVVVVSGLVVEYFGVDLTFSVVVLNCVFIDGDCNLAVVNGGCMDVKGIFVGTDGFLVNGGSIDSVVLDGSKYPER